MLCTEAVRLFHEVELGTLLAHDLANMTPLFFSADRHSHASIAAAFVESYLLRSDDC